MITYKSSCWFTDFTGNIITPDLYIACEISGSIQHVEGIKNTKTIISININKNAPINTLGNIVVIGDAKLIINKLIDIL